MLKSKEQDKVFCFNGKKLHFFACLARKRKTTCVSFLLRAVKDQRKQKAKRLLFFRLKPNSTNTNANSKKKLEVLT